ncbi:MAG: hypothetical protein K2Q09_12140 [Phycisphaerales bacterium]|nr:hypothetical protein [Phycisphaerales bacterium]
MFKARFFKQLTAAIALSVALLVNVHAAFGDKLHLNDGRVLDGEIVRQDADFVVFKVNGKEQIFEMSAVKKVQKTDSAAPAQDPTPKVDSPKADSPAADAPNADAPKAKSDEATVTGKANRVAILNFGPPNSWNEKVGDMVGVVVSAKAFEDAIPLLEKDKVDTVVVRVKSGGGYVLEEARFWNTFRKYKSKFRLVTWIESSISAAAMSPWIISEWYMMPAGNVGACTSWSGDLQATGGPELIHHLHEMEEISIEAGRDPKIMRSMQIMEPLSYNVDESGRVTFFQDTTSGKFLLNPRGQILTMNANQAVACKFALGIAATPEELFKAMGLSEAVIAGKEASKYIDDFMLQAHKIEKQVGELAVQYRLALGAAQQLSRGDDARFSVELGKAKQFLAQIRKWVEVNPNFGFHLAGQFGVRRLTDEWFAQQEEIIKQLAQRAREAEEQRRRNR